MKNLFKKTICILLVAISLIGLCSCSKNDDPQLKTMEELADKNIAVELGSENVSTIKQSNLLKGAPLTYAGNIADGLTMLMNKTVDAFAISNITAETLVRRTEGIKIIDEGLGKSGIGIALKQGSRYKEGFDEALIGLLADGTINSLREKWLSLDGDKTVPLQNWAGDAGAIRCKAATDNEPFCYKNEKGEIVGLDVDVLLAIAKKLDIKVLFLDGEYSDLVPLLASGQVDAAVGGVSVSDRNFEQVDFTDIYFDTSLVFVVRDAAYNTKFKGSIMAIKNRLNKTFIEQDRWKDFVSGAKTTLIVLGSTFVLGLTIGWLIFLWCYSGSKVGNFIIGIIQKILGLLPLPAWLMLVYYIFFSGQSGINLVASVVAFTVCFSISIYSQLCNAMNSIDQGQRDAAKAMGYTKFKALFSIFLPQAMPKFFGALQGEVIGLVKMDGLIEFIGVYGIQTVADFIKTQSLEAFFPLATAAIFYMLLGFTASKLVGFVSSKLIHTEKSEQEIKENILKGKI